MSPKLVVLVAAPPADNGSGAAEGVRTFLHPLKFAQAFCSQQVSQRAMLLTNHNGSVEMTVDGACTLQTTTACRARPCVPLLLQALPFAQQVWAGRDKAPFFLKVRQRSQLDGAGAAGSQEQQQQAAANFFSELLQQNWRVELDAGLGGAAPETEALLVVASSEAVHQLLAAAAAAAEPVAGGAPAAGSVSVLQVAGTQAGDPLDWRSLGKQLVLSAVRPGSGQAGSNISTALEALAAATAAK